MLSRSELYGKLVQSFGFEPTEGQAIVLYHIAAFLLSQKDNPTYILRGYAGTGKTSLVKTLVRALPSLGMRFVLMAPTGRAAKVLSNYTGQNASTIHRRIYQTKFFPDGSFRMVKAENKFKNALFIVDEASMIGEQREFGGSSLLDDLLGYVFSGENCRLLLIGDTAQLPPVESQESPALDCEYLKSQFPITAATYELTEVKRQALESGILYNATDIRQMLGQNLYEYALPIFHLNGFDDIQKISPETFEEMLHNAFNNTSENEAVVICKSNKRANMFNQAIRGRILNIEGEIATGDKLMVVKTTIFGRRGTKR
jgi:exodeoxyribonuclease-5